MQLDCTTVSHVYVKCPHRIPTLAQLPPDFYSKVQVDETSGCWNWSARLDRTGYGRFYWRNRDEAAHRLAFQYTKGHIPDGLVLHHICRNKRCVNPAHLEPVTNTANIQLHARESKHRMYCKRGHLKGHAHTCPVCAKVYNSREYKEERLRCLSHTNEEGQWQYAYRPTKTRG